MSREEDFIVYREELIDEILKFLYYRWVEEHYKKLREQIFEEYVRGEQEISCIYSFTISKSAIDLMLQTIKARHEGENAKTVREGIHTDTSGVHE